MPHTLERKNFATGNFRAMLTADKEEPWGSSGGWWERTTDSKIEELFHLTLSGSGGPYLIYEYARGVSDRRSIFKTLLSPTPKTKRDLETSILMELFLDPSAPVEGWGDELGVYYSVDSCSVPEPFVTAIRGIQGDPAASVLMSLGLEEEEGPPPARVAVVEEQRRSVEVPVESPNPAKKPMMTIQRRQSDGLNLLMKGKRFSEIEHVSSVVVPGSGSGSGSGSCLKRQAVSAVASSAKKPSTKSTDHQGPLIVLETPPKIKTQVSESSPTQTIRQLSLEDC